MGELWHDGENLERQNFRESGENCSGLFYQWNWNRRIKYFRIYRTWEVSFLTLSNILKTQLRNPDSISSLTARIIRRLISRFPPCFNGRPSKEQRSKSRDLGTLSHHRFSCSSRRSVPREGAQKSGKSTRSTRKCPVSRKLRGGSGQWQADTAVCVACNNEHAARAREEGRRVGLGAAMCRLARATALYEHCGENIWFSRWPSATVKFRPHCFEGRREPARERVEEVALV